MTHALDIDAPLCLSQRYDEKVDLFAMLCERRGWTSETLARLDCEDHAPLKDVDAMIRVLEDARLAGKVITIAPDFDMDGIASGVLGYAGLCELGFTVHLHLPDYRRGHDVTPEDIAEIDEAFPDTQVLLTCDGGVNSAAGITAARKRGWTTLVTDHHQELEPGSSADVTVDPCRMDETYALGGICGAHVLYQVLEAYTRTYQPYKLFAIRWLRLFAGLGTVSDVMPIIYENRQLVRDSLSIARLLWTTPPTDQYGRTSPEQLDALDVEDSVMMRLLRHEVHHQGFVAAFEGFALVMKAFAQAGKLRDVDDLDEGFYGFYLAPAMNAPRRTGGSLADCFAVFASGCPGDKLAAAARVIENNELRKQMTIEYTRQLEQVEQPLAPWVWFSNAPAGMLGLLANKIMSQTGRPVVVLNPPATPGEQVSGSGRAPGWFDIIETLGRYEGLYAIGHAQACGVKVTDTTDLVDLAQVLEAGTATAMLEAGGEQALTSDVDLVLGPDDDCDAGLEDLEPVTEMVRRLQALRPFGHGFEEPRFQLVIEPARCRLRRIGDKGQHLRLTTGDGLAVLMWNVDEDDAQMLQDAARCASAACDLAEDQHTAIRSQPMMRMNVTLQLNLWRGVTRLQAIVRELVPAT